ncbi:MAG TPA: histidine phosphatase family protein [Actinotalea sp.]|nr:histidine phosphatase family protein [Actinotalea sp.]
MGQDAVTLVLVRHGQTPMTVSGAYSGSSVPGPGLTAAGRVQAAQAADLVARIGRSSWPELAHPSALIASPMVRTQETAAAVGRRLGLPVATEPALAECDFGAWEGSTVEQIEERWPGGLARWHRDPGVRAPGGESLQDVGDRVRPVLDAVLAGGTGRTVVAVTHSITVRVAVGLVLGAPPTAWSRVRVAPASVSLLRLRPAGDHEVIVVGMPSAR